MRQVIFLVLLFSSVFGHIRLTYPPPRSTIAEKTVRSLKSKNSDDFRDLAEVRRSLEVDNRSRILRLEKLQ